MEPNSNLIKDTSCKNCIFAVYNENTQIGCLHNRISKFGKDVIQAYDEEKEFFVIKRLCNLYRPITWNNGVKDLNKAKKESSITIDLLINCDNINEDMCKYIKDFIQSKDDKIFVKLFHANDLENTKKEKIKDIFFSFPNIDISIYFHKIDYIYSIISKTNNMFHIIVDENNYMGLNDFIYLINEKINEELEKAIIFKYNNKVAILNLVCRLFYPNLYLDYDNEYALMENNVKRDNLYTEF